MKMYLQVSFKISPFHKCNDECKYISSLVREEPASITKQCLTMKSCPSTVQKDGWMTCDVTSFSTVFQSYQDEERLIMKGRVQWNSVFEKVSPRMGIELRPLYQ